MPLLTLRDISLSFGGPPLLDNISFSIEPRDRICLVGRNGEGKSTLIRVILREQDVDAGEFESPASVKTALLSQTIPESISGSVFEVVAEGFGESAKTSAAYHRAAHRVAENPDDTEAADQLEALQSEMDNTDGWTVNHQVEKLLSQTELDPDAEFDSLSGGLKRRVLLARALASQPDILLLDEPTNHLDIPSIQWMEEFLEKLDVAILFVSHDRVFSQKIGQRIFDLDRGTLIIFNCDFNTYLDRKDELLSNEVRNRELFDKKLAEEEAWIRRGVRARGTRNQGRVKALKELRKERGARRDQQGSAQFQISSSGQSGNKVIEVNDLFFSWDGSPLFKDFSTTIWRGDRIGIVGSNGSGKTTLIELLLGRLKPESGTVNQGTQLEIAYFDQLRDQLDPEKTVAENIVDDGEFVSLPTGKKHVISYLEDFLFTKDRVRSPANQLSGGERARLLLAKLFQKPANLLILDEPTNDLDVETVDLLEELIANFAGTILVVSHDRSFLDNVVTATFVLEGKGCVGEYVGGTETWLDRLSPKKAAPKPKAEKPKSKSEKPRKMLNRERREFEELPGKIEELETAQSELVEAMAGADFYQSGENTLESASAQLAALEEKIAEAYARWEELEALADASA
ncbi:MAG: ATP-binding cassette domain-containing protein [Opitutales bacterium]